MISKLLTLVAKEGPLLAGLTTAPVAHDAWFRSKVQDALDDCRPAIPHDQVERHFTKRRAETLRRLEESKA